MFLASNCTCAVYFTYTAHVQLLAKNMAATHVHAICIRNQTNTLRFCREDNPLYVLLCGNTEYPRLNHGSRHRNIRPRMRAPILFQVNK